MVQVVPVTPGGEEEERLTRWGRVKKPAHDWPRPWMSGRKFDLHGTTSTPTSIASAPRPADLMTRQNGRNPWRVWHSHVSTLRMILMKELSPTCSTQIADVYKVVCRAVVENVHEPFFAASPLHSE